MNKQNMVRLLRMFDAVTPEERELALRVRNLSSGPLTEALLRRHSRASFVGEPIVISLDMRNPLPNPIEFENLKLHLKTPRKCDIYLRKKE